MKRFIVVVFLFLSIASFSRTNHLDKKQINGREELILSDTVKIAIDIRFDTSGKVISAIYREEDSTSTNTTLIEMALKKAKQLTIAENPKLYTQRVVFTFVIVG